MRRNGESAEVKRELVRLARDYSIATPYTSLLIVPETGSAPGSGGRRPAVRRRRATPRWSPNDLGLGGGFGEGMGGSGSSNGRTGPGFGGMAGGMAGMGRGIGGMGGMGGGMGGMGGGMGGMGGAFGGSMRGSMGGGNIGRNGQASTAPPPPQPRSEHEAETATTNSIPAGAGQQTSGKEAVDLAQGLAALKTGAQADNSEAPRTIAGRRFRKVGDAWVDQGFTSSTPTLRLRILGTAYFRLLDRHPELGPVFALGKRITWVSPNGTAVIIDAQGREDADQASLDRLFGHK